MSFKCVLAQPVDATLYLKGEMECAVMGQRFHRGFTAAEKTELWDRCKRGESLRAIGRAFGRPSSSGPALRMGASRSACGGRRMGMTEQAVSCGRRSSNPATVLPQKRSAAYGWPFCHIANKTAICHNDKLLFGALSFTTLLGMSDVDIAGVVRAGASRGNAKKTECGIPHGRRLCRAGICGG